MTTTREKMEATSVVGAETPRRIVEPIFDRQPKYKQLLTFGYFTRYFDVPLIHECFGDIIPLSTARRYCKTLRERGYFKAAPQTSNTDAPVHSVTNKTVRYLNQIRHRKQPLISTRDETMSPILLPHELGLSRVQIDIYRSAVRHSHVTLPFGDFERRYKHPERRLLYPTAAGTRYYEPDLGFLLRIHRNGQVHLLQHLLEFDKGTEDPDEVLAKMQALDAWFANRGHLDLVALYRGHQAADPKPAYRRLIVTQHVPHRDRNDEERLIKLVTHLLFLPTTTRHNIFITTADHLAATRTDASLMAMPIWYPLRFTRSWQSDFESLNSTLDRRMISTHARNRQLYEFVRHRLSRLSPFALFPPMAK